MLKNSKPRRLIVRNFVSENLSLSSNIYCAFDGLTDWVSPALKCKARAWWNTQYIDGGVNILSIHEGIGPPILSTHCLEIWLVQMINTAGHQEYQNIYSDALPDAWMPVATGSPPPKTNGSHQWLSLTTRCIIWCQRALKTWKLYCKSLHQLFSVSTL